jgi:hypothetical protein
MFSRRSRRLRENRLTALSKRIRVSDSEGEDDEDHSADAMLALTLQQDELRQAENEALQASLDAMDGVSWLGGPGPSTATRSRPQRRAAVAAAAKEASMANSIDLLSADEEDDILSSPLTSLADENSDDDSDADFTLPSTSNVPAMMAAATQHTPIAPAEPIAAQPNPLANAEENRIAGLGRRGRYNYVGLTCN